MRMRVAFAKFKLGCLYYYSRLSESQYYHNVAVFSRASLTVVVAFRVVSQKPTPGNIGSRSFPSSRPVDLLPGNGRILTVEPIVMSHDFKFPRDGIQIEDGVVRIPIAVIVDSHMSCNSLNKASSKNKCLLQYHQTTTASRDQEFYVN